MTCVNPFVPVGFRPSSDSVGLRGSHTPLSWSKTTYARDDDGDGVYRIDVPFKLEGDSLEIGFKIKVDGLNNPGGGWQRGSDLRTVVFRGKNNVVQLGWSETESSPPENLAYADLQLDFPAAEFAQRRKEAMQALPDGLIMFQAKTELRRYAEHAILQDPNFYYFTGLNSALSSILVIDSPRGESLLFTPSDLYMRSDFKPWALIERSQKNEALLGLNIADWGDFKGFVDKRISDDANLKDLYGPA